MLCLGALSACTLQDVFTLTNQHCFASVKDGALVDDSGYAANITESAVPESTWKVEGARWYVSYDILNRNYDVKLTAVEASTVAPTEPLPEDLQPGGPMAVGENSVTGKYFNIRISHSRKKGSDYPYSAKLFYSVPTIGTGLNFRLVVDDNGENLLNFKEDELETAWLVYSFKIDDLLEEGRQYTFQVTWDYLVYSEGKYLVLQNQETI